MKPGLSKRAADGWLEGRFGHALRDRSSGLDPEDGGRGLLIVKFGGSLLSRPCWPALAASLLAARSLRRCCLVVGGGAVVDGLRQIDRASTTAPHRMHRLAIEAMGLTGSLVADVLGMRVAGEPSDDDVVVLDVEAWLARDGRHESLPIGWQVTSDSIAARVASVHRAGLLVAKSRPPPPCPEAGDPLAALAAAGWVDDHFPVAARGLGELRWAAPAADPCR